MMNLFKFKFNIEQRHAKIVAAAPASASASAPARARATLEISVHTVSQEMKGVPPTEAKSSDSVEFEPLITISTDNIKIKKFNRSISVYFETSNNSEISLGLSKLIDELDSVASSNNKRKHLDIFQRLITNFTESDKDSPFLEQAFKFVLLMNCAEPRHLEIAAMLAKSNTGTSVRSARSAYTKSSNTSSSNGSIAFGKKFNVLKDDAALTALLDRFDVEVVSGNFEISLMPRFSMTVDGVLEEYFRQQQFGQEQDVSNANSIEGNNLESLTVEKAYSSGAIRPIVAFNNSDSLIEKIEYAKALYDILVRHYIRDQDLFSDIGIFKVSMKEIISSDQPIRCENIGILKFGENCNFDIKSLNADHIKFLVTDVNGEDFRLHDICKDLTMITNCGLDISLFKNTIDKLLNRAVYQWNSSLISERQNSGLDYDEHGGQKDNSDTYRDDSAYSMHSFSESQHIAHRPLNFLGEMNSWFADMFKTGQIAIFGEDLKAMLTAGVVQSVPNPYAEVESVDASTSLLRYGSQNRYDSQSDSFAQVGQSWMQALSNENKIRAFNDQFNETSVEENVALKNNLDTLIRAYIEDLFNESKPQVHIIRAFFDRCSDLNIEIRKLTKTVLKSNKPKNRDLFNSITSIYEAHKRNDKCQVCVVQ